MTAQRQAWVLAPEGADWAVALMRRLEERGLHVESVGPDRIGSWQADGRLPAVRSLPHLVFIAGTLAGANDFELLRLFDRPGPWRGPPRIVVVETEDRALVDRCHSLGVANVVLVGAASTPTGQAAIETTARYWTQTSLLPNADYFVAEAAT
jgi:hypothetical protein